MSQVATPSASPSCGPGDAALVRRFTRVASAAERGWIGPPLPEKSLLLLLALAGPDELVLVPTTMVLCSVQLGRAPVPAQGGADVLFQDRDRPSIFRDCVIRLRVNEVGDPDIPKPPRALHRPWQILER